MTLVQRYQELPYGDNYHHCQDSEDECAESIYSLCSQQSSTNLTASDLPGPGRTIGLLYSRWGRALEASVGRLAHRSGYGPDAVASRIQRITFKGTWIVETEPSEAEDRTRRRVEWSVADANAMKLRSDCQKLAVYVRADISQTRMHALLQIIRLVTMQPRLRAFFNTPSVLVNLRFATRYSSMSSYGGPPRWKEELREHLDTVFLAKQALVCIEDNPMNVTVENILQLPFSEDKRSGKFHRQYTDTMMRLLEFCWAPRYAFVAKRHLYSALNYLPWVAICEFSSSLVGYLEYAIARDITAVHSTGRNESPVDIDGTERLTEALLLPRCRGLHAFDPENILRLRPRDHALHCRCSCNTSVAAEMRELLALLRKPAAQEVFPRAAAIVHDIWQSE